jgi:hypothetical protein
VFVNLFNNQWSTNFRLWNGGTWSSRVRLWLADGEDAGRNLITPAEEVRSPLMAAYGDGPAGKLPTTQAGLRVSRTGLKVTAFGPNPDGEGLVLRLWELSGAAGPVQVELPAGCKARSVQPVDLRGRAKGPEIPVNARLFTVELKPFAPAGFTLR